MVCMERRLKGENARKREARHRREREEVGGLECSCVLALLAR